MGGDMPLEVLLKHLNQLAQDSLCLWDLPDGATARLINVSENATYLVEAPEGFKAILRVHRENYHTRRAIECELAWIKALIEGDVVPVCGHYIGKDGQAIQESRIDSLTAPRFLVLFHFKEGDAPDESCDLTQRFGELGAIAARTHLHSLTWARPASFERLTWDLDQFFGPTATWGDWRDGPEVTPGVRTVLEATEQKIRSRLNTYGRGSDRYGLIHADMRLANMLIGNQGTWLIDFDDCGFSWFLYDFAASISFMEDDPRVPTLKAAWIAGYRLVRNVTEADEAEIDTFVMLRRMALLAWIGSHIEAPEPQALAPGFAATTAFLAEDWLKKQGSE